MQSGGILEMNLRLPVFLVDLKRFLGAISTIHSGKQSMR
jgi:hypothetical protein